MKKILLIATGGTMVSLDKGAGLTPEICVDDLLAYIPEIVGRYELETVQIFNIESSDIEPYHWVKIVDEIQEKYDAYDGFVVIHGTDSLAYTASALSYMIQNIDKTIVVTGSQYSVEKKTTDAVRNLLDSCRFAAESEMPGVYVVFHGKAMLGNHVKKVRSKSFEAFDSVNYPDAAAIRDELILKYYHVNRPKERPLFSNHLNDNVFLLKFYPGIQPEHYAFVGASFRGVVMEGYGVAGIPISFMPLFQEWHERGITMVVTTQVMMEGSDIEVYPVGRTMSKKYQILQGHEMTVEAILTKLMHILGNTTDGRSIEKKFYQSVQEDMHSR